MLLHSKSGTKDDAIQVLPKAEVWSLDIPMQTWDNGTMYQIMILSSMFYHFSGYQSTQHAAMIIVRRDLVLFSAAEVLWKADFCESRL